MTAFNEAGKPAPAVDFDLETVFARLDCDNPPERTPEERLANLLDWTRVMALIFGGSYPIKTAALLWVATRHYGNKSASEDAAELGITRQAFSKHTAKISRALNIRNGWQRTHRGGWRSTAEAIISDR